MLGGVGFVTSLDEIQSFIEVLLGNIELGIACRPRRPAGIALQDPSFQNDSVQITLNDQVIYQRPLEGNSDTQIGLYRSSRASESRIRNATLTGDWPSVLPNDLLETTD